MSNLTCPRCKVELSKHEAGACLNAWLGSISGCVPNCGCSPRNIQVCESDCAAAEVRATGVPCVDMVYSAYSTSLDAMAEVEAEIERRGLVIEYLAAVLLEGKVDPIVTGFTSRVLWAARHATALQCARAAIAVLEKE